MKYLLICVLVSFSLLFSQDGKSLYNTYCSACHSVDGKGANKGAFPPLAKSEWVQGDSARAIQVILHGLEGEITVTNKSYNLVMPPQGSALTNEQIAKILTYVRSSWGNKESPVTVEEIVKQRQLSQGRTEMWKASALLEEYPLLIPQGPIKNLISYAYVGKKLKSIEELRWEKEPDVEEEKSGFVSSYQAGAFATFSMRWVGVLDIEQEGEYTFVYQCNQQGALIINGKEVINKHKGGEVTVFLQKGYNDIEIEYLNNGKTKPFILYYTDSTGEKTMLSAPPKPKSSAKIILKAEQHPLIYRNFFDKVSPRGIAVAYPQGINICFDADKLSLKLAWQGEFINAAVHWVARGQGGAVPSSSNAIEFDDSFNAENKKQFQGYKLNEALQPIFVYKINDVDIEESIIPLEAGQGFKRILTLKNIQKELKIKLSNNSVKYANKILKVKPNFAIKVHSDHQIVNDESGVYLVVPKASANKVQLNYIWK